MKIKNTQILVVLIVFASISRLLPHIPNFTPIVAIGLFSTSYFSKYYSYVIPVIAMFLSDIFLGFHSTMIWVYGSLILIVFLGNFLLIKISILNISISVLTSSVIFFLITNIGVWISTDLYSKTLEGLFTCFLMAIPFFGFSLSGDIFYSSLLFGLFAIYKHFNLKPESIGILKYRYD